MPHVKIELMHEKERDFTPSDRFLHVKSYNIVSDGKVFVPCSPKFRLPMIKTWLGACNTITIIHTMTSFVIIISIITI